MVSSYKAKQRVHATNARKAETSGARDHNGRPLTVIELNRFAQAIEYGLHQRYRAGDIGVTEVDADPYSFDKTGAVRDVIVSTPLIKQLPDVGNAEYAMMTFAENVDGIYTLKTGVKTSDGGWSQRDTVRFITERQSWQGKNGSGRDVGISVAMAVHVAEKLGIRELTAAAAWEGIATGNHSMFGWMRKRPDVIEAMQARAGVHHTRRRGYW